MDTCDHDTTSPHDELLPNRRRSPQSTTNQRPSKLSVPPTQPSSQSSMSRNNDLYQPIMEGHTEEQAAPYSMTAISRHPGNRGAVLTPKTSAILTSCAGGALYGLAFGIIGGLSDPLIKDRFFPDATKSQQSLYSGVLSACILFGAAIGCSLSIEVASRYGRRVAFRWTGIICAIASVLLAIVPNFELIIVVRTILGLSVGFATALCPWYVTDTIPANVRGSISTIFQINVCGFILVAELINFAFHPDASDTNIHEDEWKWKVQFATSVLPGIFIVVLSYIMHESPLYLNELDKKAQLNLTSVTNTLHSVVTTTHTIGSTAPVQKKGMRDLFRVENLKWVFVGFILSGSQQLTGINAIIVYAPKIFTDAGFSNPLVLTIAVVGTWNLCSVFISFVLVDRLGRRPLMLGALFVMFIGSGLMALAYNNFPDHKTAPALLAIILFIGAFECGPGPLFFVMAVDSYPEDLRDPALSYTQSVCWLFSIMLTFGFPVINDGIGPAGTFGLLSLLCVVFGFLIWWKINPDGPTTTATPDLKHVNHDIESSTASNSRANDQFRTLETTTEA